MSVPKSLQWLDHSLITPIRYLLLLTLQLMVMSNQHNPQPEWVRLHLSNFKFSGNMLKKSKWGWLEFYVHSKFILLFSFSSPPSSSQEHLLDVICHVSRTFLVWYCSFVWHGSLELLAPFVALLSFWHVVVWWV